MDNQHEEGDPWSPGRYVKFSTGTFVGSRSSGGVAREKFDADAGARSVDPQKPADLSSFFCNREQLRVVGDVEHTVRGCRDGVHRIAHIVLSYRPTARDRDVRIRREAE